jgi:hypothetical protein
MSTTRNVPNNRYVDRVEPLGTPSVARQLTAGTASASTALTSNVSRLSIRCRNADTRYVVGVGTQTANASTSHFIANGERIDIAVPQGASIGYIRAGTTDGILEITELV